MRSLFRRKGGGMNGRATAAARFGEGNLRLRRLLRAGASEMAEDDTPLMTAAIAAAAKTIGVKARVVAKPRGGETPEDAVVRIARSSGLIARETQLTDDFVGSAPAPILAFRRAEDGAAEPVLLFRRWRTWRIASGHDGWKARPLGKFKRSAFEDTAFMILPALPDGPLSPFGLLRFGSSQASGDLAAFASFSLLAGSGLAALPLLSGPLFETIIPENEQTLLRNFVLFLGTLFVVNLVGRLAAGVAQLRIEGRIGYFVRAAAIDRAIRVAATMDRTGGHMPSAPIFALSAESLAHWRRGVWNVGLGTVSGILLAAPSVGAVATTSPSGAFLLGATVLAFVMAGLLIARRRVQAIMTTSGQLQSWMVTAFESLSLIETVRATAAEGSFYLKWARAFGASRGRMLRGDRIGAVSNALEASASTAITLSAILAMALAGGIASPSAPLVLIVAAGGLASAVTALLAGLDQATGLAIQYRMIRPILDASPEATVLGSPPPPLTGQIECARLTVRYRDSGPAALANISFTIEAGEHVGIVGSSGAGKSTLIKALIGLAPIEQGAVRFDGLDLSLLDDRAVRRQIGIVGQAGRLFPGTLYENVAGGRPLDRTTVEAALDKAGLTEDVAALPLGLATPLGDTATVVSGGQVQRILLARAFAGQPKILLLDEATSALDPELQTRVAHAIDAMGATVITIAHRLETLTHCDRILVLDKGRLVEAGSFQELAQQSGLFSKLLAAERKPVDLKTV